MKYQNPAIESSYQENDLGKTFYDLVLKNKPKKIVEFGVLNGYSTVAMAMALDELGEGHIVAYDLFDEYPFKNSTKENTQENIDRYGLARYITLEKKDFFDWLKDPEPFDLLHVDVSNKGDIIEKLYEAVKSQVANGALVLFEGGTKERDNVAWMIKYEQKPITGCSAPYRVINESFPGLSMFISSDKK